MTQDNIRADNIWVPDALERGALRINMEALGLELLMRGPEGAHPVLATLAEREVYRLAIQPPVDQSFIGRHFSGAAEGLTHYTPEFGAMLAGGVIAGPFGAAGAGSVVGSLKAAGHSVINSLRAHADITDPGSVQAVINNPARWHEIKQQAFLDGGVSAGTWAALGVTGGLAAGFVKAGQFAPAIGLNVAGQSGVDAVQQMYDTGRVDLSHLGLTAAATYLMPLRVGPFAHLDNAVPAVGGGLARRREIDDAEVRFERPVPIESIRDALKPWHVPQVANTGPCGPVF